jgi:hypothetical protein
VGLFCHLQMFAVNQKGSWTILLSKAWITLIAW